MCVCVYVCFILKSSATASADKTLACESDGQLGNMCVCVCVSLQLVRVSPFLSHQAHLCAA